MRLLGKSGWHGVLFIYLKTVITILISTTQALKGIKRSTGLHTWLKHVENNTDLNKPKITTVVVLKAIRRKGDIKSRITQSLVRQRQD
jgi:hypothetical protein